MELEAFFERLDGERVVAAIRAAEASSRGEIRVHVTAREVEDAYATARAEFEALGMMRTAERNGVLLLVAPRAQAFAVVGDAAVDAVCGAGFWRELAADVETAFRAGRFTDGLVYAIERVGDALARHFPRAAGSADVNELPDTISRD